jgi:type IV secretion system protein VirB10
MTAVAGAAWRSDGLVVPLGDPITDDLGRAGIPGVYDNSRMWKGIGTALLFDAATAAVQLPQAALLSRTGGNTYLNFNATQNAVQAALSQLVTQPPIIFKNQGEEIGILITKPVHAGAIHYEVVR